MDYSPKEARCEVLARPNITETTISLIILIGITVSYLPQHLRIITRRSSEGLSPYFVLLGTTSSTFAVFNTICLAESLRSISCCREVTRFACFASLLGVIQVAVQW